MRVRFKFIKQGNLRFIGHLDVMRYFQKLNRRAQLDVKYSEGYSPHQIMTFSTPLGLGDSSAAEYMDVEFISVPGKQELLNRMNAVNVPEMQVLDARILPDDAKNAMSVLAAADYMLTFREDYRPENTEAFFDEFDAFMAQDEIVTLKETKKSRNVVNIKPQIRAYERRGESIFFRTDTGSVSNLKPELVLKAFYESTGRTWNDLIFQLNREEQYGEEEGKLIPLLEYGNDFL